MPEAQGIILIKASDNLLQKISNGTSGIKKGEIEELVAEAGIKPDDIENYDVLEHEGIEIENGFAKIDIFGSEWMEFIDSLVKQGSRVCIFGYIKHEYGATGFYALNDKSERFSKIFDYESEDELERDPEALYENWLEYLPELAKKYFVQ
jgi:hypothetical protein